MPESTEITFKVMIEMYLCVCIRVCMRACMCVCACVYVFVTMRALLYCIVLYCIVLYCMCARVYISYKIK